MAQIYISIGSNIEKDKHIGIAIERLQAEFPDLAVSNIYESEPVGFAGNNFYNLVAGANTQRTLADVCALLKRIEKENGRTQGEKKFSPRTLDLDLLFYDDVICDVPAQLPRDEITKNAFVLLPLFEIAPDFYHPVAQQSIAQLWQSYHNPQQKLWKVDL